MSWERARRLWPLALVATLVAAGWAAGLGEHLDTERLRALVVEAGPLGVALMGLAFVVAPLVSLPGMVLVAVCLVAWGPGWGLAVALVGAFVFVSTPFLVGRCLTGREPPALPRLVQRALVHLERRPVLTVALLRSIMHLSPPLSWTLSLTRVRTRDYLLGSALGLVVPVGLATGAVGWLSP